MSLRRLAWVVLAVSLVVGAFLRVERWHQPRSLWLDPAMLALEVVEKGPLELLGPLGWSQAAPAGFLLGSKVFGAAGGYSERALTLLPLLLSLGSLVLFVALSVRVLGGAAILAFLPLATSSTAVYYAAELKQYAGDLLCCVLVLLAAVAALDHPSRGRIWCFAGVCVASLWFSHPVAFVIAGSGCALLVGAVRSRDRTVVRSLAAAGGLVVAHGFMLYLLQILPSVPSDLFAYHEHSYLPPPVSMEALMRWWGVFAGFLRFPLGQRVGAELGLIALLLGLLAPGTRRDRLVVLGLGLSLSFAALASVLRLYPTPTGDNDVNARFVLFALPLVLLLMGRGVAWLAQPARVGWLACCVVCGVFLFPAVRAPSHHRVGIRQEMRPLVAYLRANHRPTDTIFVDHAAVPAFRFYTRDAPPDRVVTGAPLANSGAGFPPEIEALADPGRIWVVVTHDYSGTRKALRRGLRQRGEEVATKTWPGAFLGLYELRGELPSSDPTPDPRTPQRRGSPNSPT